MRTLTTINGREIKGDAYRNLGLAIESTQHAVKPVRVMLGDADERGGWFWVVTPADAARLERAGYEYAN
jgi:hypothetical protein